MEGGDFGKDFYDGVVQWLAGKWFLNEDRGVFGTGLWGSSVCCKNEGYRLWGICLG